MIRVDGYYISEGFPWVDWHASHKFEGIIFKIFKFFDNGKLLRTSSETKMFDNNLIFSSTKPTDCYSVHDQILEITIDPNSKWSVKREFTILSSDVFLDENLKEYRFVPVKKSHS